MNESVTITKEAGAKKSFSSTRNRDEGVHLAQTEPERQLGTLRGVIDNLRRDGGTPSVDSIATELSSMHSAQRASAMLALQQTHGNRYVQRVVTEIQAKLKIGQPGDKYEQEADRVADAVMRMPEPAAQRQLEPEDEEEETLQSKPLANQITPLVQVQRQEEPEEEEETLHAKPLAEEITPLVQRQIEPEEEKEELQAKATSGPLSEVTPNLESHILSLKGGGQPLPKSARAYFEPRFGRDLSRVRVHTDAKAAESAQAVNAKAFTVGQDVVFGAGQYAPGASEGRRLMAHELTHVVQQKNYRKTVQRQSESNVEKREYGEEYEEYAKLLKEAMEGWGTEEELIFEVLQKVHGRSTAITSLKKAYKNKYGTRLEDDLRDEMSGSELDFALSLLCEKPPSKDVEIKPRTLRGDDYTEAVDRLVDAIEGPGTDEELIYAVLVPFAGAFDSIRKLKDAYKGKTKRTLEEDLESELSGDELEYALKLLHAPLKPAKGMPEKILSEAERENAPGIACTVASIKRYVRAYLDYYYLDGELYEDARGNLSPQAKVELKNTLESMLGDLGRRYLDGGPTGSSRVVGVFIRDTLKHSNLFGNVEGRRFHRLWQIAGAASEETAHGAAEALATRGLGEKVLVPETTEANIKAVLWNEVLKPGAVIQTWTTEGAAENPTKDYCDNQVPSSKKFGHSCGHSFIFVEYVYSSQESPPDRAPRSWYLHGGSGTPLDVGGEEVDSRKYDVKRGDTFEKIAEKFGVTVEELKAMNKSKIKTWGSIQGFNVGETIIIRTASCLVEMRNLRLVGMRIIDQRGYHFIPKDSGNINNKVLPDNVPRVKWLAQSEFWVAAQLT